MKENGELIHITKSQNNLSPWITVLNIKGALNAGSLNSLSNYFDELISEKKYYIIADFSSLEFISSPVVGMLMGCKRRLAEKNGNLVIVGATPNMKSKLSLMGADRVFNFYSNMRTAVNKYNWDYEKHKESFQVTLPSKLAYVPALRRLISQIVLQKGYGQKDSFRVETIIDEISNNAIEHGTTEKGSSINVNCDINNDKIEISIINKTNTEKIVDAQKYFSNIKVTNEVNNSARGRGLAIVRKLSQDLQFKITENGTEVHITKKREEQ